jgi:hypothetical protein
MATSGCGLGMSGQGGVGPMAESSSSGGPSSSGGVISSGGSSSSDSGGLSDSTGTRSDAGPTDPEVAYAVTLKMDSFNVGAGQEVFMCQDFANPFQGQQADIKTYELHMAQGSHHMLAFYKVGATDGSVEPCPLGGLQFGPFTFSSQSPNVSVTYPEGVGATIPSDTGFTLNAHYTNPGTTSITGQLSLTMYVAKPGLVTQHAGILFLNQISLVVPPGASASSPYTSTATYELLQDVNILATNGHMHQRALDFVATTSKGQTLYQTSDWSEAPNMIYSPPLHLAAGTSITWSCTYTNDTVFPLVFGEYAQTNVMCISASGFYPVQDVRHPVINVFR